MPPTPTAPTDPAPAHRQLMGQLFLALVGSARVLEQIVTDPATSPRDRTEAAKVLEETRRLIARATTPGG